MNCKQGDMAVVMESVYGHEGKIVRCVRFLGIIGFTSGDQPTWEVDPELPRPRAPSGHPWAKQVPDHCLRPIQNPGEDAQDETLSWLPVPHKEAA